MKARFLNFQGSAKLVFFFSLVFFFLPFQSPAFAQAHERRIISLAPSATEWIVAFGLEDKLRGVTEQCDFPKSVRAKEKVGSFLQSSLEKILALRATDVVVVDGIPTVMRHKLESAGMRVHLFNPQRLVDFPDRIFLLGQALGASQKAREWSERFRVAIDGTKRLFVDSKKSKRRALIFIGTDPIYLVGPALWLSDLFSTVGVENALYSNQTDSFYPRVSLEGISKVDATLWIGFAEGEKPSDVVRSKLRNLNERIGKRSVAEVKVFSENLFQRPGPRLLEALQRLRNDFQ